MAEQTIPVRVKHTLSLEISDNAFWISFWAIGAIFLLLLTLMLTNRSLASEELIAKSADPVATACATDSTARNQCMALLARHNCKSAPRFW